MATKDPKHEYDESVEGFLSRMVIEDEIATEQENKRAANETFEDVLQMFEGKRSVKDYDWYTNLSLKEATSIILTDVSSSVNQYFQTRDFVEVVNEGDHPNAEQKCMAVKKCINKSLNNRRLYHYQKFSRSKLMNNLYSHVYAICQWKQDAEKKEVGTVEGWKKSQPDDEGYTTWERVQEPIYSNIIHEDRFDYDVLDSRTCWESPEFTYSVQDKKWFAYLTNRSLEELKGEAKANGYINIDLLERLTPVDDTESERLKGKGNRKQRASKTPSKDIDVYTRLGGMWAIVEERDSRGFPSSIKPGYDKDGNVLKDAEYLKETIMVIAVSGANRVLIRFTHTPYIDSRGRTYKPVVRGICYPHPTKDTGLGDGELLIDLDAASNDAFCLGFDRGKLQTIPTMIGDKNAVDDNTSIRIEPGHTISIEGGPKALEMFKAEGNLRDIMEMKAMIDNRMEQVTATYPTTMGNLSSIAASTTATAIAGAENRTNARGSFKSITFEYTFLTDLYWMCLQMVYQFATVETMKELMGEDVYYFDPDGDYTYSPVTGAIEAESSKFRKIQVLNQTMQTVAAMPNPNTPAILNVLLNMLYDLLGPDYAKLKKPMMDTSKQSQMLAMQNGMGGGGGSVSAVENPASNQYATAQSIQERAARDGMKGMYS